MKKQKTDAKAEKIEAKKAETKKSEVKETEALKSSLNKAPAKRTDVKQTEAKVLELEKTKGSLEESDIENVIEEGNFNDDDLMEILDFLADKGIIIANQDKEDSMEDQEAVPIKPAAVQNDKGTEDALNMYFSDISKYKLLNREEEVELSKRIIQGDEEAKDLLINSNLRLVASIAKKYRRKDSTLSYGDLISYGNSGLIKAAEKFDYRRGCRFSTYANFWIRQSITRALSMYGRPIKLPVYLSDVLSKIKAVVSDLTNSLGRAPDSNEIAKVMGEGYSAKKVDQILSYDVNFISLDKPTGNDDSGKLEDIIPDTNTSADFNTYSNEDVNYILSSLSDRERRLIILRYGLGAERPHTLEEVGKSEGVTRERARQIIVTALKKMRVTLNEGNSDEDNRPQ